jgi:hypothetical protein
MHRKLCIMGQGSEVRDQRSEVRWQKKEGKPREMRKTGREDKLPEAEEVKITNNILI